MEDSKVLEEEFFQGFVCVEIPSPFEGRGMGEGWERVREVKRFKKNYRKRQKRGPMMKMYAMALIMLSMLVTGCFYAVRYDGPYEGRIVDAETGAPIEGVVVLGVWYTETPGLAGAISSYYDATETVTDKNGEFRIQGLGIKVITRVVPMDVLIFKAGYEHIGMGPWESFRGSNFYKKIVKWEGEKAIIPLRRMTMEERKNKLGPASPPSEAPLEKVILMLKEIDKDDIERGLSPRGMWNGKTY